MFKFMQFIGHLKVTLNTETDKFETHIVLNCGCEFDCSKNTTDWIFVCDFIEHNDQFWSEDPKFEIPFDPAL